MSDDTQITTSSARRLHYLLGKALNMPGDPIILHGWASILGTANDLDAVLPAMTQVYELYHDVLADVKQLDKPHKDIAARYMPKVGKALYQLHWGNNWGQLKQHLDEATLLGVEAISIALEGGSVAEKALPESDISSLRVSIEELIQEIGLSDELSEDLKVFLTQQLEIMQAALGHYRIHGGRGLKKALQVLIGVYQTSKPVLREQTDPTQPQNSHIEKFWAVVARFADLTTLAATVAPVLPPLLEAAKSVIPK